MTPVPRLATILGAPILYDLHRDRILYAIDRLPDVAEIPGPKFVYAHILVGHAPFVFGARGERVNRADAYTWTNLDQDRDEYIKGYRDQVSYLNGELRETLTSIIEKSARSPVIVVFGDHGPASRLSFYDLEGTDVKERYSILNAYHLPPTETNLSSSATDPYPSISPVNTFRVIFNRYFGTDYPLLEDKSFFIPFFAPYRFIPVPDEEREDESETDEGDSIAHGAAQKEGKTGGETGQPQF